MRTCIAALAASNGLTLELILTRCRIVAAATVVLQLESCLSPNNDDVHLYEVNPPANCGALSQPPQLNEDTGTPYN